MTAVGVSVFFDGFLWFFGYWIPAFAGMTAVGFGGAARMTGVLRGFCLEYIIFFAGGGILHYWVILREGVFGALGWCGRIGGGGNIQRLSGSLEVPDSRVRGNDGGVSFRADGSGFPRSRE
ncbi:hypothetical protein B2G52_09280 [Neisseria lactamica]|uniref:Integral membrane protein n=1 Tax=Neisseria lactamica TaxID=486 RepID=A0AAU8VID7_NEILA|nr:hypothetical protein B2G52_09280 [Neisseria lactamica]